MSRPCDEKFIADGQDFTLSISALNGVAFRHIHLVPILPQRYYAAASNFIETSGQENLLVPKFFL